MNLTLLPVIDADLPLFFEHQLDPIASHMAAFTRKDPKDRAAFDTHWSKIRSSPDITIRTILLDNTVAGHVATFMMFGEREITYWIAREFWGKGIATAALKIFLPEIPTRPLFARAAADNVASIRVLSKCGFVQCSMETAYANARNCEIEEVVMKLE
jgi:RimJ/RimL family protein N-acetyltransferase